MDKPRLLDATCEITLQDGSACLVDRQDWPLIQGLTLYRGTNGYVYFSTWRDGKSQPQTLHSFLMQTPKGLKTDHINGDKLDNRRSVNLRIASNHLNGVNRHVLNKNNRSGVRGVQFCPHLSPKNPWRAQITVHRKNLHIGLFSTMDEAISARREAEREHWGAVES